MKTKLTDERALALAEALRTLPVVLACDLVGISDQTYYDWRARGEAGEAPYAAFLALAREGRAAYVRDRLQVIEQAAGGEHQGDWKAAAWYLERCHAEHFATKTKTEISGPAGEPLRVRLDLVPDEDLDQLERILASACAGGEDGPSPTPGGGASRT